MSNNEVMRCLKELLDDEATKSIDKEAHVWSPRPYLQNTVGTHTEIVWHTVVQGFDDKWCVTRYDKFVGATFPLDPTRKTRKRKTRKTRKTRQ